jgi:hypothetical protein
MPEQFYSAPPKRRVGPMALLGVGVVVLVGLGAYAVYLTQHLQQERNAPVPTTSNTVPQVAVTHQQPTTTVETVVPIVSSSTDLVTSSSTATTTASTTSPFPILLNPQPTTTTPVVEGQPLPSAPDTDGDQLTTAEETLYGTSANTADSDADGYADGAEVLNAYDPRQARSTLRQSGRFSLFTATQFSIQHPATWTAQRVGGGDDEVNFRSGGAEFVSVVTLQKPATQTLRAWFAEQFADQDASSLTVVQIGAVQGLRSADLQTYYLVSDAAPGAVYVISYTSANLTELNYLTTFAAMVKTFQILP